MAEWWGRLCWGTDSFECGGGFTYDLALIFSFSFSLFYLFLIEFEFVSRVFRVIFHCFS